MRRAILLLLLGFNNIMCTAQNHMWTNLTRGIQVNAMAQEGPYLWFGTTNGLFKYDTLTHTTQVFDISNSPLLGDQVEHLSVGAHHEKWIKNIIGYCRFNEFDGWTSSFEPFEDAASNSRGELWVTDEYGVKYFNGSIWKYYTQLEGYDLKFRPTVEVDDQTNAAWVMANNIMLKCDSGTWQAVTVPTHHSSNLVNYLPWKYDEYFKPYNGDLYILNEPGTSSQPAFLKWHNGYWRTQSCNLLVHNLHDVFLSLHVDPYGNVKIPHGYIDTVSGNYEFGVYYFSASDSSWSEEFYITGNVPFSTHLLDPNIFMAADKNNNFYISYGLDNPSQYGNFSGLWKLTPRNTWSEINISNSALPLNWGTALSGLDTADNLIFCYEGLENRLYKMDAHDSVVHLDVAGCIDSANIMGLLADNNNNIWLATTLNRFGYQSNSLINITDCHIYPTNDIRFTELHYHNGKIYSLAVDSEGTISIASFDGNSFAYEPYSLPANIDTIGGLHNLTFADTTMYALGTGSISNWITYPLYRYSDTGWQHIDYANLAIPYQCIRSMAVDSSDNLWVLNYDPPNQTISLLKFDGNTWTDVRDFPPGSGVASLCIDGNNLISIYWNHTLYQYNGVNWQTYAGPASNYFELENMLPRKDGTILITMVQDGLVRFNKAGKPPTLSFTNTASGSVYFDDNYNYQRDSTEIGIKGQLVGDSSYVVSTDENGDYWLSLDAGDHVIKLFPQKYIYAFPSDTQQVSFTYPGGQSIPGQDFGCHFTLGIQDLQVTIANGPIKPGDYASCNVNYRNNGTVPISGSVRYWMDPSLVPVQSGFEPEYYVGDTVKWQFSNLLPGQERSHYFYCFVSQNDSIDQVIHSYACVTPIEGDTFKGDNIIHANDYVVSSYDPNEKTVSPANVMDTSATLTYTIFFQNTGNDTATNVIISDTLAQNMEVSMLKIIAASHKYSWSLNGHVITFRFENIYLPDSGTNPALSHGFVKYSIMPKANVNYGDTVSNTAYIYFDYNSAVQTNTTVNVVTPPVVIYTPDTSNRSLQTLVFPNPASKYFTVCLMGFTDNSYTLRFFDLKGNILAIMQGNSTVSKFDCTKFSAGTYIYEISAGENKSRGKLIIN